MQENVNNKWAVMFNLKVQIVSFTFLFDLLSRYLSILVWMDL